MFKFDEELKELCTLVIRLLIVQWVVFWTIFIFPTQEKYVLIKDGYYELKTYRVPQDVSYEIDRIEAKNITNLSLIKDFQVFSRFDCAGIVVERKNVQVCDAFLDKNKRVTHIELYERHPKDGYKIVYEIKGLEYENSRHEKIKIEVSGLPYESQSHLNNAKFKFVMSIIGSSFALILFFYVFYSTQFAKSIRKDGNLLIYLKNTIKYVTLILIVYQFIKVWMFLFKNL